MSSTVHQLDNGLTLVVTEQPHLHAVALSYTIRCGSRHDPRDRQGLSHFLEHMMFRGSARYPSASALIAPFERAGGTLSAETWRDHTHFSAVLHPAKWLPALRALGDMMTRPAFLDLEAERALVQAELLADLDEDGLEADLCNASRSAVWPHHALGRGIVGTESSLAKINDTDIRKHHKRFYGAKNAVLSIAGHIKAQDVYRSVCEIFAALPQGKIAPKPRPPRFCPKNMIKVRPSSGSQLSLALTFPALAESHPEFLALELLCAILDDGMGSRLHRALSERQGLVYDYESGLDCYTDTGLYELEMQVSPSRALRAIDAALEVFDTVARKGISELELREAKERAKMAYELGQDNCEDVASQKGLDQLFCRPSFDTWQAALDEITIHDIQNLAGRIFGKSMHAMLMGPVHRAPLSRIQKRLEHSTKYQNKFRPRGVSRSQRAGHGTLSSQKAVAAPCRTV